MSQIFLITKQILYLVLKKVDEINHKYETKIYLVNTKIKLLFIDLSTTPSQLK